MKKSDIESMFAVFQADNPEPQGELDHVNVYTLLVAVALSAQATDKGVNKATKALFQKVRTPEEMLALGEEKLIEHIKTIGLYRSKAKNVIKMAVQLVEYHQGEVPNDQKALEALAGVGRKTANVVRNIAFGEPTVAVDTHIFRIGNRTGLCKAKSPDEMMTKLPPKIPMKYRLHAHHWLILHGRYVCTARRPKCGECMIEKYCAFKEKNL